MFKEKLLAFITGREQGRAMDGKNKRVRGQDRTARQECKTGIQGKRSRQGIKARGVDD
jgi:hypothetical protein